MICSTTKDDCHNPRLLSLQARNEKA